jgi:hypothetical protein
MSTDMLIQLDEVRKIEEQNCFGPLHSITPAFSVGTGNHNKKLWEER